MKKIFYAFIIMTILIMFTVIIINLNIEKSTDEKPSNSLVYSDYRQYGDILVNKDESNQNNDNQKDISHTSKEETTECIDDFLKIKNYLDVLSQFKKFKSLNNGQQQLYFQSLEFIKKNPSESIPFLIDRIIDHNQDMETRIFFYRLATNILFENNLSIDTQALKNCLEQENNPQMQSLLIDLISFSNGFQDIEYLVILTESDDEIVKVAAVNAIGKIHDDTKTQTLKQLAQEDSSFMVRMHATRILAEDGKSNKTEIITFYRELLITEYERTENKNMINRSYLWGKETVIMSIVNSITKTGAPEAIPILLEILHDKKYTENIKQNAMEGLGKLKAKEAEPDLVEFLKSSNEGYRFIAAIALTEISGDKYLSEIQESYDTSESAFVRMRLRQTITDLEE